MKRHIIRISLVMLLGVVTSVAVAWGCAWLAYRARVNGTLPLMGRDYAFLEELESGDRWMGEGVVTFGYESVYARVWTHGAFTDHMSKIDRAIEEAVAAGYTGNDLSNPYDDFAPDAVWWLKPPSGMYPPHRVIGIGWPLICLRGSIMGLYEGAGIIEDHFQSRDGLVLPWHPVWPGLLANTAIYGGVWWAMLFGPAMFIRWRRRRAGRCAKCGYDLRASETDVCPECGHCDDRVSG